MPMQVKLVPYRRPTLLNMGIPQVMEEMQKELQQIGKESKEAFKATFSTWVGEIPQVNVKTTLTKDEISVEVSTENQVAQWLDEGTTAHMIVPRRKPRLVWQRGYIRKTRVGSLQGYPGGPTGVRVSSSGHMVQGIRARKFSYTLSRFMSRGITARMNQAARRGAAKAHQ